MLKVILAALVSLGVTAAFADTEPPTTGSAPTGDMPATPAKDKKAGKMKKEHKMKHGDHADKEKHAE